jgi:hypothetical protein
VRLFTSPRFNFEEGPFNPIQKKEIKDVNSESKPPETPSNPSPLREQTSGTVVFPEQKKRSLFGLPLQKIAIGFVALVFFLLTYFYLDRDLTPVTSDWGRSGKTIRVESLERPISWWKRMGTPDPAKIKKLVEKNGIKARKIRVIGKERTEEGTLWTYQIQIRVNQALIQPQQEIFEPQNDLRLIAAQLRLNEKLPTGMIFTSQPKTSMPKDEIAILEYKVLVSEEETLISENPFDLFLTQDEWKNCMDRQSQRIASLNAQVELIKLDARKWGESELAKVPYPSKPNMSAQKWRGNAGTGEPTKSVARVGSGAAVGAGIGALAGKTEGGLIGALAGAVAGGIYDAVSKSNDEKKYNAEEKGRVAANRREYEREMAAYNRRKKEIEEETATYYRTKLLQLAQTPVPDVASSEFPLR